MGSRSDNVNWREKSSTIVAKSQRAINKPFLDKSSLGIACCRYNKDKLEILLVCKRFTYSYNMFVHGKYSGNNMELIKLFNGMTVEEKLDICSLNFTQIWYRVWLNFKISISTYTFSKSKFEKNFLMDGGVKLRSLINKSSNAQKIWEIPKGHKKNKTEIDIHCAIREFYEETGISKKNYKLFLNSRMQFSYIDDGIKYNNTYFIAFTQKKIIPKIDFSLQEQVDEISDIRWMNIEDVRYVDQQKHLVNNVRTIFNYIKKYN